MNFVITTLIAVSVVAPSHDVTVHTAAPVTITQGVVSGAAGTLSH